MKVIKFIQMRVAMDQRMMNLGQYIINHLGSLLLQGSVPIVLGGLSERDYSRLAPPNSYLHVDQFKGPEDLAAKVISKT